MIIGTVTDAAGAVMPGVKVEIIRPRPTSDNGNNQ